MRKKENLTNEVTSTERRYVNSSFDNVFEVRIHFCCESHFFTLKFNSPHLYGNEANIEQYTKYRDRC